jgi:hypothetical protein
VGTDSKTIVMVSVCEDDVSVSVCMGLSIAGSSGE